jgi:hypothetical protein
VELEILLNVLLFLLYSMMLIFVSFYIYKQTMEGWTLENFFLALFLLFYAIIPISFIINDYFLLQAYSSPDIVFYSGDYFTYSFTSLSVTIIFLFFFFIGIHTASAATFTLERVEERSFDLGIFELSVIKVIGLFLSLLSFVSMFIYASQFGGFEQAIYYANWVNAGYIEEAAVSTEYVFVNRFIYFSLISFSIFFFIQEKDNIFYLIFLFVIPLATTLFSRIFLFSGKESIIDIALLLLLYYSIKNRSAYLWQLLLFTIILYFAIPVMDMLIDARQDLSFVNMKFFSILQFLEYFTFPQISLEFALNKNDALLLFDDFIYGLRGYIVPFSWLKEYAVSSMELNTYHFTGEYSSIVPPGILAFSYYSFGLFGIVFIGFGSGFIIKKLDTLFLELRDYNSAFSILHAFFMTSIFSVVRSGVPKLTFYDTTFIVLILLMLLSFKFHLKKADSLHE